MIRRVEERYFVFGLFIFVIVSLIVLGGGIYHGAANTVKPAYAQGLCDPRNLTGKWLANDGGTYFIRHIGNEIWWFGARNLQEGTPFSNVLQGNIGFQDGRTIVGNWRDIPLGNNVGKGTLVLSVDPSGQKITKVKDDTGSNIFGGTEWKKNCRTLPDVIKTPPKLSPFVPPK
jgi:hypothetical protein